jgi:hypothetical protein
MRFVAATIVVLVSAGCASRLSAQSDDALIRDLVTIRDFDGHAGFGTPEGMKSYGWEAKDALVERGPLAIPTLVAALRDPNLDATQKSLVRLTLREMGPRAAPAVPALVEDLARADARTAVGICMDLNAIGPGAGAAVPDLLRLLRERGDEVVGPAVAVGDFVAPESHLRAFVAATLGAIGPRAEAALPALAEGASQTNDVNYRRACRTSMRRILGPEPTVPH